MEWKERTEPNRTGKRDDNLPNPSNLIPKILPVLPQKPEQ